MTPDTKKWPPDWWHHLRDVMKLLDVGRGTREGLSPVIARTGCGPRESWRLGPHARRRIICGAVLIAGLGLLGHAAAGVASAAESDGAAHKEVSKSLTGTVSGVGPQSLAVEYDRDEKHHSSFEMAFPVGAQTVLEGVKSLKALKLGDQVAVEYQETTTKDESRKEQLVMRVTKRISLVKAAPAENAEPAETEAKTN